eukprot:CAMPEP_0204290302 /NCGR_PEP_ID=MMETSP0468-20130131/60245_1 /ASSEMBLY_ACC=CAM_ASM_000383 /TAXON_ID=2969 /ORGANISM="Oxyrrhis marina" /LENGTH=76 /DNA_ID=CAMNT_0051268499 /DNA_START=324 /DNA_END=551 /DNA_ORIENTATION=+
MDRIDVLSKGVLAWNRMIGPEGHRVTVHERSVTARLLVVRTGGSAVLGQRHHLLGGVVGHALTLGKSVLGAAISQW